MNSERKDPVTDKQSRGSIITLCEIIRFSNCLLTMTWTRADQYRWGVDDLAR